MTHGAKNLSVSASTHQCRVRGSRQAETEGRMSRLPRVLPSRALAAGTGARSHRISRRKFELACAHPASTNSRHSQQEQYTGRGESNFATKVATARWGWQICPAQHNLRSRAGVRWPKQPLDLSPGRVKIMRVFI